jgi:hypothetical protein
MSCQGLREAIVEVARGRAVGVGTQAAVETHVEVCDACAALARREEQLSAGLRSLAATTSGELPSDDVRRRLMAAFEAQRRVQVPAARQSRWQWRQAAAAAATLAAVIVWWQADDRGPASSRVPETKAPPAPAGKPAPPAPPPPKVAAPATTQEPMAAIVPPKAARTGSRPRPARAPRVMTPEGFVMLPAAAGLPDFESGSIVRMELPVTMLPTYGVDLGAEMAERRDTSVEADLLVGQDGQPRAIRLVAPGSR